MIYETCHSEPKAKSLIHDEKDPSLPANGVAQDDMKGMDD